MMEMQAGVWRICRVFLPFLLISGMQKASSATSQLGIIKPSSRRLESGQWAAGEAARRISWADRRCTMFLFPSRGQQRARHHGSVWCVSRLPGSSQQMTCRRELCLSASNSVLAQGRMCSAKCTRAIVAGTVLLARSQSGGRLG